MQRMLSLALCLALTGSALPVDAAQAIVRINPGAARPVVSAIGTSQSAQFNFSPSALTLTAPSLTSQNLSITPSVLPTASLTAPTVLPTMAATAAGAPLTIAVAPAETPNDEGPLDAARHLDNDGKQNAGDQSGEQGKVTSDQKFDGTKKQTVTTEPVAGKTSLYASLLARFAPKPPAPGRDEHGGPARLQQTLKARLTYGLKWGLNMTGLAALLQFAVKPVLDLIPWQFLLPDAVLQGLGRVELLRAYGPETIAQALSSHPVSFLLFGLPTALIGEEITFRVLQFGLVFLSLAAVRPLASWLSKGLGQLPDVPLRRALQAGLSLVSRVSSVAFPAAAILSSLSFAVAHFAAWGVSPYVFVVQAALGLALARVAYRTRSLSAPFLAHLTYNVLGLLGGVLAFYFLMPQAAALYGIVLALAGLSVLWYNFRVHMKAKHAAAGAPRSWKARILPLLLLPMLALPLLRPGQSADLPVLNKTAVVQVQAPKADTTAVTPPLQGKDTIVVAPAVELPIPVIVEMVKPAVIMVLTETGSGSGFIITPEGLLVTNAHVVADVGEGGEVIIQFANMQQVPAKVVALNRNKDIAFVQLPPAMGGWPTVPLGDSEKLTEGSDIVAIGYPLGLPFSVSRGIVSGIGFRGSIHAAYMQHDASVNPGNSGGPLFNRQGEVVGMNSAIATQGGGFDGISYAIPTLDIQKALTQLRETGNINSSWLGIVVDQVAAAKSSNLGVQVEAVRPGSPAAQAGLKNGDLIIAISGQALPPDPQAALQALATVIAHSKPGDKLELGVVRMGRHAVETIEVSATLGNQ